MYLRTNTFSSERAVSEVASTMIAYYLISSISFRSRLITLSAQHSCKFVLSFLRKISYLHPESETLCLITEASSSQIPRNKTIVPFPTLATPSNTT